MPDSLFRRWRASLRAALPAVALLLMLLPAARAATVDDLLPVDEAFVLSTQAQADGIAIEWKIADGYYLYRHRTSVQADAGFEARPLQLPVGKKYKDEFFGDVETYRGSLTATLPGTARGASTTLKIKYQGCADIGVCYPPQTRSLQVALGGGAEAATEDKPLVAFGAPARGAPAGPSLLGGNAIAAIDATPLPDAQAFGFEAIAGDGNRLLLRFTPARGYYLYRDKTILTLDADGIALGTYGWPKGTAHRDAHFGEVAVYFQQIDLTVPLIRRKPDAQTVQVTARFQGCQTDGICYPPMTRTLKVALPAGTVATTPEVTPATSSSSTPPTGAPTATGAEPAGGALPAATAIADDPAPTRPPATSIESASASSMPPRGADMVPAARGAHLGAFSALALALLGGLILNLMPCVLPVLSLKALSLVDTGQSADRARNHALWYTAGVLVSFAALGALALALREAGVALGWGFQLQQPVVVAALGLVMLALGLSLSGVWHAGGSWTGAGHGLTRQSGPAGDFFTGVLAVVVATPCTAPFMGAALAWAFTAPTLLAMAVFLALGLGLALPFVLIGIVPRLASYLPRPGAWMETLKQVLAFPLYLTAAWLAWVLGRQRGVDAIAWWLVAAIATAFVAWAWTHARSHRSRWAGLAAAAALFAVVWPLRTIQSLPRPQSAATAQSEAARDHVAYSEQRLADLRAAGRVVFVNMTADWCVTCKANEKTVFAQAAFRQALTDADAVYMVGDWTDVDPELTTFLQRYQAVGVPLYVVFPRGGGEGRVLPTVLTPGIVNDALRQASAP